VSPEFLLPGVRRLTVFLNIENHNHVRCGFFRMYHDCETSLSEWIAVLSIARRFGFRRAGERAIIEIESPRFRRELGPVQKIVLAKKYDIQVWLPACYEALCQRHTGLEDTEAEILGPVTTNHIWKAREAVRENRLCGRRTSEPCDMPLRVETPTEWDVRTYDVEMVANVVKEVLSPPPVPPVAPSPISSASSLPASACPGRLVACSEISPVLETLSLPSVPQSDSVDFFPLSSVSKSTSGLDSNSAHEPEHPTLWGSQFASSTRKKTKKK
jgi:hypothetical protein